MKKIKRISILLFILMVMGILGANWLVEYSAKGKVFNSTIEIPFNKVRDPDLGLL